MKKNSVVRCLAARGLTVAALLAPFSIQADFTTRVQGVQSNKCIEIAGSSQDDGANGQQWTCNAGQANQTITFRNVAGKPGVYNLAFQHSDKCLDVYGAATNNGTNLVQWSCVSTETNQQFALTAAGTGQYKLVAQHSSKLVDVQAFSTANGGNLHQWQDNNTDNQFWRLLDAGPGGGSGGGPAEAGEWSSVISWPEIAISAATLPDGRILTWSSTETNSFPANREFTHASLFNPANNSFATVDNNFHDMFCAGISMLEDGRIVASGGNPQDQRTSAFNPSSLSWSALDTMNFNRWYGTNLTLPGNQIFSTFAKAAGNASERYDPASNSWTQTTGASMQDLLNEQNASNGSTIANSASDMQWWSFMTAAPDGRVFHGGPTPTMHWFDPAGSGSTQSLGQPVGQRTRMWGNSVTYDVGKVLMLGGSDRTRNPATTNAAYRVDLNGSTPQITATNGMTFSRALSNGVTLPTGEVLVIGGNITGKLFDDVGSVLAAEIWNPQTEQWRTVASMSVPRNYHSTALLLKDGRVLSAGGGACGNCPANHQDGQIYSPPYLFNSNGSAAARPSISSAPSQVSAGASAAVGATAGVSRFSMVRLSGTTHAINTDQRFVPVNFSGSGGSYTLSLHPNPNVLIAGYYWLFAVDANGVPSVGRTVQVVTAAPGNDPPGIGNPGNQTGTVGDSVSLALSASDPNGDALTFSASGLPAGLSISAGSGVISGILQSAGSYTVTVSADDGQASTSASFGWTVNDDNPGSDVTLIDADFNGGTDGFSYVDDAFRGTSQGAYASGTRLTSGGFSGGALRVLLGGINDEDIFGMSGAWQRSFTLSAGQAVRVSLRYRLSLTPQYEPDELGQALVSIDGRLVGQTANDSVAQLAGNDGTSTGWQLVSLELGTLSAGSHVLAVGAYNNKKTYNDETTEVLIDDVTLLGEAAQNQAPVIINPGSQTSTEGDSVNLVLSASDPDGDALTFSASGLPAGLSIASASGEISGTAQSAGSSSVTVSTADGNGGSDSVSFSWLVEADNPPPPPPPAATGANSTTLILESSSGFERAWNVNPDNGTVTVSSIGGQKLAEIAVGSAPWALAKAPLADEVWVANKDDASLSVIDSSSLNVVETLTLAAGSQPHGLVFRPGSDELFVVLEATGQLLKIDAGNGTLADTASIGNRPRHLAVSANGDALYVARFITPPLAGEDGASVVVAGAGGEVLRVNPANLNVLATYMLAHVNRSAGELQGPGVPNYLSAPVVSPSGATLYVPSKQDNIRAGTLRGAGTLRFDQAVRAVTSIVNLTTGTEQTNNRIDHDNASVATGAVISADGRYLFVALETSREVAVIDTNGNSELLRIAVDRAPQGLALSATSGTLAVHNFMSRSIALYDVATLLAQGTPSVSTIAVVSAVASERLTAQVLNGKRLFYDAADDRLAADNYLSCAACHNDGDDDGRVWDFTQFGEGVRNTISLEGKGAGHGLLHWTGNFDEAQDFNTQIINLAGGSGFLSGTDLTETSDPLGPAKAGRSADLDALAAYLASLNTQPANPNRGSSLSSGAETGRQLYADRNCADCHAGSVFSDSVDGSRNDVGTITAASGSRLGGVLDGFDTPTLLGLWNSAPYLHDGSAQTVAEAILGHDVGVTATAEAQSIAAFLAELQSGDVNPGSGSNSGGGADGVEFGSLSVSQANAGQWQSVSFSASFSNPIVVMGPVSLNNGDPVHTRLRNVTASGFEYQLEEWSYLDGTHASETVSYLALEAGTGSLGGLSYRAGTVTTDDGFASANFAQSMPTTPIVLAQIASENDATPVTQRLRNVTSSGFQHKLQEEEAVRGGNNHGTEALHYIALVPGNGDVAGEALTVASTGDVVTHNFTTIGFTGRSAAPTFLANMQSQDGGDTAVVRLRNLGATSVQVQIDEEQSSGSEVRHTAETVGYVAIGN